MNELKQESKKGKAEEEPRRADPQAHRTSVFARGFGKMAKKPVLETVDAGALEILSSAETETLQFSRKEPSPLSEHEA